MEILGLEAWLGWFLIGTALLIVEVAIAFTFYAAPIALGAFAAAIVAGFGGGLELQLIAFIIGALASLAFLRPLVRQHLQPPAPEKSSNVQSLLGRRAITLERVDADSGTVRLGDDVWSARTASEDVAIPEGDRVEVVEIRGVYVYVRPAPAPSSAEAGKESAENE
jgi:membrane protein implicated in regulation of membrane protease activity